MGVGWAVFLTFLPFSPCCPRKSGGGVVPLLCFEMRFLFLGSPGVADGCGEMIPSMLQWENIGYIVLDKERQKLALPLRF